MSDESDEGQERREGRDRQMAELWQQILRQELKHRKTSRDLFEYHERIIGTKVRQLRAERGWTQADLGRRLDSLGWPLDQTTISNLELGRRPVRVAEADALAMAFGIPMLALWYLPVAGEPWSMAKMRRHLQEIDDSIAELEQTMQRFVSHHADYQFERLRLSQAINEAAKAAESGQLEDLNLDAEETDALVEGMDDEKRRSRIDSMEPEQRAALRDEQLEAIESGEVQRLAAEAWSRYQAGDSLDDIGAFLAAAMPPGVLDPLRAAMDVIRDSLGQRAGGEAREPEEVHE